LGAKCSSFNPYDPSQPRRVGSLECHNVCSGPGTCASKAGLPFLCMAVNEVYGECYPADFGLPCSPQYEQCMGHLKCISGQSTTPDAGDAGTGDASNLADSTTICTTTCDDATPCSSYNLTSSGYCQNGICQRPRETGKLCDSPQQCNSKNCGVTGTCL
jgi:hypothetical protein